MSDRKRVFCKDCKWYKRNSHKSRFPSSESPPEITYLHICNHDTTERVVYSPIHGKLTYTENYKDAQHKNANCDCADYEDKEGDSG